MENRGKEISFFLKLLFIPILFELILGGGGRFLEIGPLTLRMYFFGIAVLMTILFYFVRRKISKNIFFLFAFFTLIVTVGIIVGIINGAPFDKILEDVKPLSFFLLILYFPLVINQLEDIYLTTKIIKIGSLILSLGYIVIIILILMGIINYFNFYTLMSRSDGEVLFRSGPLFFYKGFLYLGIGFFFFSLSKKRLDKLLSIILFATLILTLTRGFIIFTVLLFTLYLIFQNKKKWISVSVIFIGIAIMSFALPLYIDSLGNKAGSDYQRFLQIHEVQQKVTAVTLLVGNGFGIGTDSRPVHMEIAFLEIFHKQGMLGLIFWLVVTINIIFGYFSIKDEHHKTITTPFFYSSIFVIIQSFTNPFINNPIGLSILLISIVIFNRINVIEKIILK